MNKKYKWRVLHHCNGEVCFYMHKTWFGAFFSWLYQYIFNHEKGKIQKIGFYYYD